MWNQIIVQKYVVINRIKKKEGEAAEHIDLYVKVLSALSIVAVSIIGFGGFATLSLQHNNPCEHFQQQCNHSQYSDHYNVSWFPFLLRAQNVKASENVENSKDNDGISKAMVVDIPEKSILVILFWPEEQCKNLQNPDKKRKGSSNRIT